MTDSSDFFKEGDSQALRKFQLDTLKEKAESDYSNIKGLFYLIPIAACITNEERIFEEVNGAYCRLYGYEREELVGQSFLMVIPDSAKDEMGRHHDNFFRYEHEFSGQWGVMHQDGTARQVLANAAYIPAPGSGHPVKVTFVVDVTDVASAEENLRLTNDLLNGRLAAQDIAQNMMVHDLRNPITNILSIGEMLDQRTLGESDKRWIKLIIQLAKRLERQVQSSSDLAKMEVGRYKLQEDCFDLPTLIKQVLRAASGDASHKGIQLKVSGQGAPLEEEAGALRIRADQFYIEQLITNLTINAIEASPNDEEIEVAVATEHPLRISITNRGVVPREIRAHLFDKNVTQGKEKGSGLGTYIARMIAQQHGGDLTFETSDEQQRTTFITTLPDRIC